jgi:hypothetical protein
MNFNIILIFFKISDLRLFSLYANKGWQIGEVLRVKKCKSHSDGSGWFKDYIYVPSTLLPRKEPPIPIGEMSL